jgi:hypothetical protein
MVVSLYKLVRNLQAGRCYALVNDKKSDLGAILAYAVFKIIDKQLN